MISKEVLDTMIGTVSYGSQWLCQQFDKSQVPEVDGEYPDETAVRILLNGGTVDFLDVWAEDGYDVYSDTGYFETDCAVYPTDMYDIEAGLEKIREGTWNYCDDEQKELVESDLEELMKGEDSCFDIEEAERIMQVILFNEIVY